jgi:hypothetical protein
VEEQIDLIKTNLSEMRELRRAPAHEWEEAAKAVVRTKRGFSH